MNFLARLIKCGILFLAGISLIITVVSCVPLSEFFPSIQFSENQENPSVEMEEKFASIDGIDCIPDISSYEVGTLIKVIDGDSIRVSIQGSVFKVRYIGMDTPEYDSDQYQAAEEATEANRKYLSTSLIYLFKDQSETDQYGRLLRYVIANDKFVNLELVRSGHARVKKYFPDTSCYSTFIRAINK